MPDAFDRFPGTDSAKGDAFDRFPVPEESKLKSALRYASQIPLGVAELTGPGIFANLSQLLAMGDVNDPEEMERIKAIAEREGIPFDEEAFKEAGQQALGSFPTVSNLARMAEEQTGFPLEAKTKGQKLLKLASSAGKATPGTAVQKGAGAATASAVAGSLEELGVPEQFAELAGFGAALPAGAKTPAIEVGKIKKPSGLTQRRYEKLEKPTEVSPQKIKKINEKVENEFRDIASDIIEKSPIEQTYSALKEDSSFKQQASDSFKQVESLSEEIPETFKTDKVKKSLADIVSKKKGTGFLPSEFEKNHNKFIKDFIKETPKGDITAADLVKQYRKNNQALTQAYEPGQSFAYNRAKREAIQDYNKAIADVIHKEFPDTEFSNLFKSTNEQWAKIMDVEAIDKFMDKLFDGKIRFEKGREFFDKQGMTVPFERALGKEGFKNFQQLMKDLMSTEQASKLMKVAADKGFTDAAKTGLAFLIHPKYGTLKYGIGLGKSAYKQMWEMLLDKPQLSLVWDKGVKAMKKGNFAEAENLLGDIKKEADSFQKSEISRQEALRKFNEKKKAKEEKNM